MFGNFKNGIYALGIFSGYALAVFFYLAALFFDFSVADIVSSAFFGVFVGGFIAISASFYFRTLEIKEKSSQIATVVQIRAAKNMQSLNLMKKSISTPKERFSNLPDAHEFLEGLGWILEFQPLPESFELDSAQAEELAFAMRVVSKGYERERVVTIWRESKFIENRYRAISAAARVIFTRLGLPENDMLRHGRFEIPNDTISSIIIDLQRIDEKFTQITLDIDEINGDYFELLAALQDGLQSHLNVKAHFLDVQRSEASSSPNS